MGRGAWTTLAAAALLAAPAAGQAGFVGETVRLSDDSTVTPFPVAAATPAGETTVVWNQRVGDDSYVLARRVRPDGSLGPTLTISDGAMIPTQKALAVSPDGRAFIVWNESTTGAQPRFLRARWIEPDGTLSAQVPLRSAGVASSSESPAVAATADGDAMAAWRNSASVPIGQVEAREIRVAGGTGPLLQPPDGPLIGGVQVVARPVSGALIVWEGPPAIHAMPVDGIGLPGTVQTPVAAGVTQAPALTTDGADRFRVAWAPSGEAGVQLASQGLAADGTALGVRQVVEGGETPAQFPRMAANAANRSLAFWGSGGEAAARFIAPDGVPEGPRLAAPQDLQFVADVALLGDGAGILAWRQQSAAASALVTRTVRPDGTATAPATLAADGASAAVISASPAGVGLIAWSQRVGPAVMGSPHHVAIRQHLPPPECPDAAATVVQGRPTPVTLACTGLQLTGPQVLTAPANGTLGSVDAASGTVVYTPRPGFEGVDAFTFWGTNRGGPGAVRTARVAVGRDTVAPAVRTFRLNRKRVRLRTAYLRRATRKPAFVLRLSEPATARIVLQKARGKRFRAAGTLRLRRVATSAAIRLPRTIGVRRLAPGAYRATVVATDPAGNRSRPKRIRFVVTLR